MDSILRGALVVDGTRRRARKADVLISSGRIAEIGTDIDANGAKVVDLSGLCLAPGFIDIHTHYDAQVLWDPDLAPSSWHGVTTVVMGNCGFGIAPARPENRSIVIDTLAEVEGIPKSALHEGVPWDKFNTFNDYLGLLDRTPKRINVATYVCHTPIRIDVMGDAAWDRAATADEVARMRSLVLSAMKAGAIGFSSSRAAPHVGSDGRAVPSRSAAVDELFSLSDALREVGRGVIEMPIGLKFFVEQYAELSRATGRPVTWAGLLTELDWESSVEEGVLRVSKSLERGEATDLVDLTSEFGGQVYGQVQPRPTSFRLRLADPFIFATTRGFDEVMAATTTQGRAAIYADPAWRDRARAATHQTVENWARIRQITLQEANGHHYERVGPPLDQLARERGIDPFDLFLDISLSEHLEAVFEWASFNRNEDEVADLLRDPRTLIGGSDAGAHVDILCDGSYPSHLLGYWVREKQALSLETAIWRMTAQPASVFGFKDRGLIRTGYVADLVAFDPATIGTCDTERVHDLPGGATRLLANNTGIEHIWVGGVPIRRNGEMTTDAGRPGVLVRG